MHAYLNFKLVRIIYTLRERKYVCKHIYLSLFLFLSKKSFIQIYHVWEGYLRKIPVERLKGLKDKQPSTKHHTEEQRSNNKNPTKIRG
jgi:hypothetical protein